MSRLTNAEKHLIEYPPTRTTWACTATRVVDGVTVICKGILAGSAEKCWYCGKPKPRSPKLVWPAYAAACAKAGIDPDNPRGVDADADASEDSPTERQPVRGVRRGR